MFGIFKKDPKKKLEKKRLELLEKSVHAQRNGDIKTYSFLVAEAEKIEKEIELLNKSSISK